MYILNYIYAGDHVSQLLSHLYIKKKVYRDNKLENDWKGKERRKTNWKRIQSVNQEGKWSGVWKKWERNIFFEKKKKRRNFLLKYLFEKKITSRLTSSTWQCM